jgi:hypothetical protein
MDIQADIKWIRSELTKVRDPHLIEAFKQLLTYRKEKETMSTGLGLSLDRALAEKEAGKVKPHSEVKTKYEKWL